MSHWAEVNNDNQVIRVLVGDNNDPAGDEGYSWLIDNLGGTWIKTSYNTYAGVHNNGGTPLRKNYAGIGYTYDSGRDAFIPPKYFQSWVWSEERLCWQPPVSIPDHEQNKKAVWNESVTNWELVDL